jgi:hypothetical protein
MGMMDAHSAMPASLMGPNGSTNRRVKGLCFDKQQLLSRVDGTASLCKIQPRGL